MNRSLKDRLEKLERIHESDGDEAPHGFWGLLSGSKTPAEAGPAARNFMHQFKNNRCDKVDKIEQRIAEVSQAKESDERGTREKESTDR